MPRGSGSVECGSNTVLIPASAAPNGSMIAAPRPARVYTRPGGAASERDGADSATADRWGRGPGTVGSEEDGEGVVTVMALTLRFSVTSTRPASRPPSPASVPVATVEMSPSRQFVPDGAVRDAGASGRVIAD
jgi:hypothetical protein